MKTQEEIEQLAETLYPTVTMYTPPLKKGFVEGYTQCQEDMADKKLDEDDIKEMALDFIINTGDLPKTIEEWQNALWKFYESLNKKD